MHHKFDVYSPAGSPLTTIADRRAAVQLADLERAEARLREIESQTSFVHSPEERIRIWERLHALSLPKGATHPLVAVIAAQTNLTAGDIVEEQQRRRRPAQPAAALPSDPAAVRLP